MEARIQQLKDEYPTITVRESGADRLLLQDEYDQQIQEWAANQLAFEAIVTREASDRDVRTQVRNYLETLSDNEDLLVTGIANLKGPTPPSTIAALRNYVTQMAEMTLDHNRGLDRLIRVLISRGIIEP